MREKTKQGQQQLSRERQDREKSASPNSSAKNLLSIYDHDFARRAGEIVARAATAVHRRGKRR